MLGDKPYYPTVQSIGTHVFGHSHHDLHRFTLLAKGYVVEGSDKGKICEINAQIALQADHRQVFQMWCLLRSLFTPNPPSQPSTPPLSPLPLSSSISLPIPGATKDSSSDFVAKPHSPYPSSGDLPHHVSSAPASNLPSPQRVSSTTQVNLSPQSAFSTSSTTSPRSSSLFSQRPSNAAFLPNRSRGSTAFRRPSVSTSPLTPSDNATSASLRHVGEGTLDDSDSSSSDSDIDISSLLSPSAVSPTTQTFPRASLSAAPSPLSRVAAAGQQTWTEDERDIDEDSPSPASTETESEGETARKHRVRARSLSLRRRAGPRSRSSTLAPPPIPVSPLQQRPGSRSSTRTVTAHDDADHEHFPPVPTGSSRVASRVASAGVSDGLFGSGTVPPSSDASDTRDVYVRNEVQRRVEEVREVIRKALQEALEEYADAGDVQTCAMMAVVASRELGLGRRRVQLFVEAYIGTLLNSESHRF